MKTRQIKATRDRRYVVRFVNIWTKRNSTCAFATDIRAVWFMERATSQGFTILSCRAPSTS